MKPNDLHRFGMLLTPRFRDVSGKVFATVMDGRFAVRANRRRPTTLDENTDNHVHFDFFAGTTEGGVRDNYKLAEAVRVIWQVRLHKRFPRRRFRLFVSNEYQNWPTVRKPVRVKDEEVQTVLRFWSLPADDSRFDEMYRPEEVGPDRVLWPEYRRHQLVGLSKVIAVIHQTASHPAKIRTLRERWHAI